MFFEDDFLIIKQCFDVNGDNLRASRLIFIPVAVFVITCSITSIQNFPFAIYQRTSCNCLLKCIFFCKKVIIMWFQTK